MLIASLHNYMEQFIRFINTGYKSIGEAIISPDVIFYAPTTPELLHGFNGYISVLDMIHGAMPDVQWKTEEFIAEGNKVMIRFMMSGTQTQSFPVSLSGNLATREKTDEAQRNSYYITTRFFSLNKKSYSLRNNFAACRDRKYNPHRGSRPGRNHPDRH